MTFINSNNFTKCENFSLTNTCLQKVLAKEAIFKRQQFEKFNVTSALKTLALRVLASIAIPLFAIADFFVHLSFCVGKAVAAAFTQPVRLFVQLSSDLNIESPLIHLSKVVHALFQIVILPPLILASPHKALRLSSFKDHAAEVSLSEQAELLARDLKNLQTSLNQVKSNRNSLRQENVEIKTKLEKQIKLHAAANAILAEAIELINDLDSERKFLLEN